MARANKFTAPPPRPALASEALTRPNWTKSDDRDPAVRWLDRNENADTELSVLIARFVHELPPETYRLYPDYASTYKKLATHLDVDPENLVMTGGSDGAIRMIFDAYIEPGDNVLHPNPTYGMYPVNCRIAGAVLKAIDYSTNKNGPVLDIEKMTQEIRRVRPKLVCLANPDSPTGTVLDEIKLRSVIETAGDVGALILIDEAYYPFYPHTVVPWTKEYPHLVVIRSTSKAFGMAGLRLGFAIADATVTNFLHKVRPNYAVTTPSMEVFNRVLDNYDQVLLAVERLNKGKAEFLNDMQSLGLKTLNGHGNFLHVAFGKYAEALHAALANVVYYRQDFSEPCLKGYSRFTSSTSNTFSPVTDRIRTVIEQHD